MVKLVFCCRRRPGALVRAVPEALARGARPAGPADARAHPADAALCPEPHDSRRTQRDAARLARREAALRRITEVWFDSLERARSVGRGRPCRGAAPLRGRGRVHRLRELGGLPHRGARDLLSGASDSYGPVTARYYDAAYAALPELGAGRRVLPRARARVGRTRARARLRHRARAAADRARRDPVHRRRRLAGDARRARAKRRRRTCGCTARRCSASTSAATASR